MSPSTATDRPPKRRARRPSAETREHILDVAEELFYWDGIRATGVDQVAAKAGVGPTTLYRLFGSKDDLVAAYIDRSADGYRELILATTNPSVGTPRDRVRALFDMFAEQTQPETCRGCPFLMALAEFPDAASGAHAGAVSVKAWVREHLHQLIAELHEDTPVRDPDALADQLALVVEGIYASVQALGVDGPAAIAGATAQALIDAALDR